MKTERRHQLEHNQLADTLGDQIEHVRPYFKTILAVVIAVAAVIVAIAVISNRRSAANDQAWTDFYTAVATGDAEKIEQFAEAHPGTKPALLALLNAGEIRMQRGSLAMFIDRKEAESDLDHAKRNLETVVKEASNDPTLLRRAQLGLASVYEAQNLPEDAEPLYEQLQKAEPDGPIGKLAAERIEQLRRLNSEKWYAWFEKQRPTPLSNPLDFDNLDKLPSRNDLTPGGTDDILPKLLEDRLKVPGVTIDDDEKTAPDATKTDDPVKPAEATPDATKPEATKPDAATPPTESKADAGKPAETKPADPPANTAPDAPKPDGAATPETTPSAP